MSSFVRKTPHLSSNFALPVESPSITSASLAIQRLTQQNAVAPWEGHPSWQRQILFKEQNCGFQLSSIFQLPSGQQNPSGQSFVGGWIEPSKAYCSLCEEPLRNLKTHSGYWDHVNLGFGVYLFAAYPRLWDLRKLVGNRIKAKKGNPVDRFLSRNHMVTQTSLNECDYRRFASVAAVLRALSGDLSIQNHPCHRDFPISTHSPLRPTAELAYTPIRSVFSGQHPSHLHMGGQGERIFRVFLCEIMTTLLPPMSAQCHTRLQQKAWGRKNLERLYDLLRIRDIQEALGGTGLTEKNQKGQLMRQLFYHLALCKNQSNKTLAKHSTQIEQVRFILTQWLLFAMAHELIFLSFSHYAERIEGFRNKWHWPDTKQLQQERGYPKL